VERLTPTIVLILVTLLVFALLWWGWRRRAGSQSGLPAPARPREGSTVLHGPVDGMYVATTTEGDPYDRIAVHGLGLRTPADVVLTEDGVVLDRAGTGDFLIPWSDVHSARTAQGMIGKFVEPGGLVVIGWTLAGTRLETGFRTRAADDRAPLITSIRRSIEED
jgi:hypothetical protein